MADVVGLRFVTTGEKEAIAAYDRYKAGLLSLGQVQDKHVAAFNRRANEEVRALQRQDAEARKAFQNRLRYDREKEQAAAQAARAAEQAAQQEARAIQRQDAEARKAFQQYLRYQQEKERAAARTAREIEQAAEREARAQRQAAQETARLTQSYNQLLASIDPVIARQQRTRQTVDMLRAAVAAGAITTAQAAQALNQYRNALRQTDAAGQIATRGMNRFGVITQQAGYQVGDFVVQIQSGTNVMVAFGQQATQLIGTFAMLARTTRGIAIFSALGIVVPILTAIGAAMMRTSGASDTLEQKLQKLEESGNKLETTLNRLEDTELDQKFGSLADEVLEISEAMLALDQSAQLNNLMGVLDRVEDAASAGWFRMMDAQMAQGVQNLRAFFNPFESMVGAADVTERENEKAFGKLGFDMARSQFLSYTEELQRLAQAGDTEGVVEAFNRFIQDATDNGAELSMTGIALAASMERSALATAEIAARLNGSAQAAADLAAANEARAKLDQAMNEETARQQAALSEENARFEQEQIDRRGAAEAAANERRVAAIELYYDNLEKAEAERERVEAARAQIRQQRAEEDAALQKAMAQQVADQQAALLEDNARYEQEVVAKREQAAARHLATQAALYQAYADSRTEADALSKALVEAYRAGEDLSSTDVGAGVDAAAVAAAELARQMGISLSLAQGMVALGSGLAAPGGPDQARENVRNTYSGIAGLREEDIVARFTLAARDAPRSRRGGGGGGGGAPREQEDYLKNLLLEAQHKQRLVGLTEEQTRRQELLFDLEKRKLPIDEERIEQIIRVEAETRKLLEAEARREQLMQSVESNITSAFMAIVDGSASVEDAFRSMMRNILLAVYEQMVAQPAAAGISNLLRGVFGGLTGGLRTQANGGGWNNGVQFFANGGVVNAPTMFGHSSGLGVMGEAGPEAIMPLKRGADGKLGVSAGGGGSLTVNVVMDPSTGALGAFVQDQAGQVVAKAAPQLAQHAAKSMVDQRRRGGSMKAVFRG